jgi:hypothetical protein
VALASTLRLAASDPQDFRFAVRQGAEVIADLELSSPGSDWSKPGREAALASLTLDSKAPQHVMVFAGETAFTYAAFLGRLPRGPHRLRVERNDTHSAPGAGLRIHSVKFREIPDKDPYSTALAHAPVLYARANTIGRFTDIPLLAYCERITEGGRPVLQYTTIFSNEDGGTSTRALMARWGRTTDIEYTYRYWLDTGEGSMQARDHREAPFRGSFADGRHPLLIPSTQNNMVSDEGTSSIRYQLAPRLADLSNRSREFIMDEQPVAYRVMAQEIEREGKIRPFGVVDGEKISDPRNYLYIEAQAMSRDAALSIRIRRTGEDVWRSSHLGRADFAISRDGWFRTTVELPPGTTPDRIGAIGIECQYLRDNRPSRSDPASGSCRVEAVTHSFFLDRGYKPGPDLWRLSSPLEIPAGELRVLYKGE